MTGARAIAFIIKLAPKWETFPEKWGKLGENSRLVGYWREKSDAKGPDVGEIKRMRLP
jgi:hypothetical protein